MLGPHLPRDLPSPLPTQTAPVSSQTKRRVQQQRWRRVYETPDMLLMEIFTGGPRDPSLLLPSSFLCAHPISRATTGPFRSLLLLSKSCPCPFKHFFLNWQPPQSGGKEKLQGQCGRQAARTARPREEPGGVGGGSGRQLAGCISELLAGEWQAGFWTCLVQAAEGAQELQGGWMGR